MQSIDEARGFQDSSVENNFSSYERSVKQINLVFGHLGRVWKVRIGSIDDEKYTDRAIRTTHPSQQR